MHGRYRAFSMIELVEIMLLPRQTADIDRRGGSRRGLDRATRSRRKERRSLNALRPIRDWHVVMPLISRRFDDRVWNVFVAQTFGVTGSRRASDIIDVNSCVWTRPRPSGPEVVVALIVRAIESPALAQERERPVAASRELAHRPAPAAVASENEAAKRRCGGGRTEGAIGRQGRQDLRKVAVQSSSGEETLGFRVRTQCRSDKNDIAPAGIRAFAQSSVREALAVPILINRLSLDGLGLETMQIEDQIHSGAWPVAVRDEDAGHRRRGNSELVDDLQVDFDVKRGPGWICLLSQQARRRNCRRLRRRRQRTDWAGRLLAVDPDDGKVIRFDDATIGVGRQDFLRHRIADIAADGHDAPRSNLRDDVAMGLHRRPDVVVGGAAARPALAYEVARARCDLRDAIGLEGVAVVG